MPITFSCSQCGRSFKADDKFAGKNVRCKQCGAQTTVPPLTSGSQRPGPEAPEPEDLYGLAEPAPVLPPRAPVPRNEVSASAPKKKTKFTMHVLVLLLYFSWNDPHNLPNPTL